jgi:negative regulator of sigma E activity
MNQVASAKAAPEFSFDGAVGALADDALDAAEAQHVLDMLLNTPQLRATWDEVHWVGDCLRSDETGALTGSAGFMARFGEKLAQEPTVLAPRRESALPKRWMRYGVPSVAAALAVTMVVWIAIPTTGGSLVADSADNKVAGVAGTHAPSAQIQVAAPARSVDPALLREYVMAHQEFGATALHGPGAIQAASFDIPATEGANRP